jgi:hypothetical protein
MPASSRSRRFRSIIIFEPTIRSHNANRLAEAAVGHKQGWMQMNGMNVEEINKNSI